MKFEVTILGSGAALPTLQRNSSAQFVSCLNRSILIDCGEGTQLQMRKFGIKFQRLSVILISHLHGDHFFGLVGLISSMRLLGRDKNLTIVGPHGLERIVRDQLEIGHTQLDFEIDFLELSGKETRIVFEDKSIEIEAFPLKHKIPTSGFIIREKEKERGLKPKATDHPKMKLEYIPRLKKGEDVIAEDGTVLRSTDFTKNPKKSLSYAYCSDTAFSEKVIAAVKGVSVLYHEATFIEKHRDNARHTMHSTAMDAARVAHAAEVGQLYMGHLSARYTHTDEHESEARTIFPSSTYVEDGMRFLVK